MIRPVIWPTISSIAIGIRMEWRADKDGLCVPQERYAMERYAEIRAEGMRGGDGGEAATEFYRQNQAAMDEGAVIAWQERFNYDELSAIQHAMNLKLQDEAAFFAEYQTNLCQRKRG